tara:strand:+ start:4735 stop:6699 length:1965 start_codon:yes stop_codon:yes gene_type:complete
MAIKRYFASKDNTITNAFKSNLTTRGTGSNMGQSDVLEVFSIYGQASSSSGLTSELARVLIEFDTTDVAADRTAGDIPASGSVSFYLKMFNAKHGQTLPKNYTMEVKAITGSVATQEWEEGYGLDMEGYTDSTVGGTGSSWANASSTSAAATATITVLNEGFIENDDVIILDATNGSRVILALNDSDSPTSSTVTAVSTAGSTSADDAVLFALHNGASTTAQAALIATAINHHSLFSATSDGAVVTITQATAGLGGNTTVTCVDGGGAGPWFSNTNFTGGRGAWATEGGDYANPDTDLSSSFTQTFDEGTEDLEIDITTLVEQWLNSGGNVLGSKNNYGVGVMLSSSHESESRSFYTKKFFARGSEFFFKRPVLEARWDSRDLDNRGNFIYSSSLATADENLNKIYLYNYFRGQLRDIPGIGTGNIYVSFFSGSSDDSAPSGSALELVVDGTHVTANERRRVVTGSHYSTGIYTASVALTAAATPLETVYDVWFQGGDSIADASQATVQFHTGSITPATVDSYETAPSDKYVTNITNLKPVYSTSETARFRVFVREKDWCPTVYNVASRAAESTEIESGSYKVFRVIDELDVVPYGTGSDLHTAMSYDVSGNYFDLDMSMLQEDYMYGIKFTYYNNSIGDWVEQPEVFKFRVEK